MAGGHPLHRLILHSSAVSMSKFRMLTRWCRVGSSSCSSNTIPLVPKVRLPLLRLHFVVFRGPLATVSQLFIFSYVRLKFLHALEIVCVFPIYVHNVRHSCSVRTGNDASRLGILHLLG